MSKIRDIHFFSILRQIPYENVSKILRLEKAPPERPRESRTVLSEHQSKHFGGTCFSLVNLVLKSLAVERIKAYPVMADIHRRSFPHFFAVAEDGDKKYLIDPGYLINEPLEISKEHSMHLQNGAIDFIVSHLKNDEYQLQTVSNGQQKTRYTFHIEALDEDAFREYWIRSFNYINSIVASRFVNGKFIYIHDNYVQIRSKGNVEKYDQAVKALYYLKKYFSMDEEIIKTANDLLQKRQSTHSVTGIRHTGAE
ncbi:MAG: arylamine N-acetyltransferase [Candidatus Marinimicrobia bacterium]|nr:arylamine N-acetyltransferase [Candidatus Neomarinimicrobiota bacterium]